MRWGLHSCFVLLFMLAATANASSQDLVWRNFTEYNFSIAIPEDWHVLEEGDFLYITDNPLVDGHWDGMGYMLIVMKNVNSSRMHEEWMADYRFLDSLPDRTKGSPPNLKSYGYVGDSWEHPNGDVFFVSKWMSDYTVLDPANPNRDTGLIYNPDTKLYSKIYITIRYNYEKEHEIPDFFVFSSTERLCGTENPGCLDGPISRLEDALESNGHIVEIIDMPANSSMDGSALSADFLNRTSISGNSTIFIVGSYAAIPPCYYTNPLRTKQAPALMATRPAHFLVSDDCYGTNGSGPAEAVVARLPAYTQEQAGAYLDRMAEYHAGERGLNHDRLENEYGLVCPAPGMKSYYMYYSPEYFNFPENISLEEAGNASGEQWQAYPLQYFALHGGPSNTEWYGRGAAPVVNNTPQDYPFASLTLACYGGFAHNTSIPGTWLFGKNADENRPNVFIGSTGISYFGGDGMLPIGSDLLLRKYHEGLESGKPAGRAIADAKVYVYSHDYGEDFVQGITYLLNSMLTSNNVRSMNQAAGMDYQIFGDPLLTKEDLVRSNYSGCSYG